MILYALPLGDVINSLRQAIISKHPEYSNERKIRQKIREEFSTIVSNQVSFGKNSDMLEYLKNEAITTELTHKSRNFIIIDQEVSEKKFEILGFFTLTLKIVNVQTLDDVIRKSFVLSGKNASHLEYLPGLLIAQFGKNLHFNKITGREVMELVVEKIQLAQSILGGKMVYLDSINEEKVISFYKSFGFIEYGEIIEDNKHSGVFYQPMALDMTKVIGE
ncbi:TPA: hypothetical protein U0431_001154 [Streptococcus suis]|nr:hypothetical protein [Streptococcus suis]